MPVRHSSVWSNDFKLKNFNDSGSMLDRRQALKMMAALPVVGTLMGGGLVRKASGAKFEKVRYRRDFFAELGVRPFINGRGTITTLSGSLMEPEVMEAINYASQQFVSLFELNEKVGQRIAEMLRCEDAHVTAGAASAIQLATAAAVTGLDRQKIARIPEIPGPRPRVVLQKGHRIYAQQMTACGVEIVEVEGAREMRRAINKRTVMGFFFNASPNISITQEEFLAICKEHGIVSFIDCAADVPPVSNLYKYIKMGYDLVTFSGGKGIRGPQSAGILYGRRDLVQAARLNHSPYNSIGRGMKVNKEEVLGMMVALEHYISKDHEAENRMWDEWVNRIARGVEGIPTVETEKFKPPVANHVPHLRIRWDHNRLGVTPGEVRSRLEEGYPSIVLGGNREVIELNTFMMQPDEIGIVARRLKEELEPNA